METKMNWVDRPLWVRIGLFGISSRKAAMMWMKGSLAASITGTMAIIAGTVWILGANLVGFSFAFAIALFLGMITLTSPLWYWLAIQWTDEHNGWERLAQKS